MSAVNALKKGFENGFAGGDLSATLFEVDGIYHAKKCPEYKSDARAQSLILTYMMEHPELFCTQCMQKMVFGGLKVETWLTRMRSLFDLEPPAVIKVPLSEVSEHFRGTSRLPPEPEFSAWVTDLESRIEATRRELVAFNRDNWEEELLTLAEDSDICNLRELSELPENVDIRDVLVEAAERIRQAPKSTKWALLVGNLAHGARDEVINSSWFTAVHLLYAVEKHYCLYVLPLPLVRTLRERGAEVEEVHILEKRPSAATLEALGALYNPYSASSVYSDVQAAFKAASLI